MRRALKHMVLAASLAVGFLAAGAPSASAAGYRGGFHGGYHGGYHGGFHGGWHGGYGGVYRGGYGFNRWYGGYPGFGVVRGLPGYRYGYGYGYGRPYLGYPPVILPPFPVF